MSTPQKTTLIIQNIDTLAVVGLDLLFFNVNELLRGIKLIPPGIHFFHYSASTEKGDSIRYGKWFQCSDGDIITVDYSEDTCNFIHNVNVPPTLGSDYAYMVPYPGDTTKWAELTRYVDMEATEEYIPAGESPITTATPLKEENMVLIEALKARDPNQQFEDQDGKELRYTIVQFKLRGPDDGSIVAERTANSLEKSWYLVHLFGHDPELLLGEIQLSFVHFIILGNLCSCTQWLTLLKLVLMSASFLGRHPKFGQEFLGLLLAQLDNLPVEYMSTSGMGVVSMKEYTDIMENLSYIRIDDGLWGKIKVMSRRKFGIGLQFAKEVDANNFEVFDLADYDEDDEDAPAVLIE